APLLTTRREWNAWQIAGRGQYTVSASLEDAISLAARLGQDSSGRFRRAIDWLGQNSSSTANAKLPVDRQSPRGSLPHSADPELWVAWEPTAGDSAADTLVVVRPRRFAATSWGLTALFLIAAWGAWRCRLRGRYPLLLLWLALNALGLLWLPASLRG